MGFSSFLIFLAAVNLSYGFLEYVIEAKATPGEDYILPCNVDTDQNVTELRWTRMDPAILLLEYKNGKIQFKHANYTNRIYLLDPKLKRGNYSLVLKNVAKEDQGMYECESVFPWLNYRHTDTRNFWFKVLAPGGSASPVKLFLPALMFSLLMGMILL